MSCRLLSCLLLSPKISQIKSLLPTLPTGDDHSQSFGPVQWSNIGSDGGEGALGMIQNYIIDTKYTIDTRI